MTFAMRWLAAGTLVSVCLLAWGSNVGRDVVGAQGSARPTVIKRIYTGTDGLSHVEDIALDAKSVLEKVTSAEVRIGVPGRFSDWHAGPQRQVHHQSFGERTTRGRRRQGRPAARFDGVHRQSHRQRSHDEDHEQGAARIDLA